MGPRRLAVLGFSSMILWAAACGDDAGTPTVDAATPLVDADSPADAQRADAGASYAAPVARGVLPSAPLPETSGLVASRRQADVLWAHNDSGNPAELFALGTDGSLRATFAVRGATNQDWEDIARIPGVPQDTIVLADTGDNLARDTDGASGRASVTLYLVPEPDVAAGDAPVDAEALTLTYPDRPYDCEAVFVDPATSDVWLLTKEAAPPRSSSRAARSLRAAASPSSTRDRSTSASSPQPIRARTACASPSAATATSSSTPSPPATSSARSPGPRPRAPPSARSPRPSPSRRAATASTPSPRDAARRCFTTRRVEGGRREVGARDGVTAETETVVQSRGHFA